MSETEVRPMRAEDVTAASAMAYLSLREMAERLHGEQWPLVADPERARWGEFRVDHIRRHDGGGSWVAERDGEILGLACATKRESIWFLSLLAVKLGEQSGGIGKRLLDASLTYAADCSGAWIMSSLDPRALRRYHQAGFALQPSFEATGQLDRSLLSADAGVGLGEWDADGEWMDRLVREVRGAGLGVDVEFYRTRELPLLTLEQGQERGFAILNTDGLYTVCASRPSLAARLLSAAIAMASERTGTIVVGPMTGLQPWAIDVCMSLRLRLQPGAGVCTRGQMGPLAPYIPNGAFG